MAAPGEAGSPSFDLAELLPRELVWLVFACLPVDQRLLLNAVCRSWRAALREASLWRELDFSLAGGVTRRVTWRMINAAVRYARGQLRLLDVRHAERADVPFEAILDLARENAATLATLRVAYITDGPFYFDRRLEVAQVDALLAVAPRLTRLECGVQGEQMLALLRKEPPYTALRLTHARCDQSNRDNPVVNLQPLLQAVGLHNGIRGLSFHRTPSTVQQLEATVDVAIRLQLSELGFYDCLFSPAHLPGLTRLLTGCPSLESFLVCNRWLRLVTGDTVPAFCAALRASSLKHLALYSIDLWDSLPDGIAVIEAITGHRSLTSFICNTNLLTDEPAASHLIVGQALGRLVAAESHLKRLDLSSCDLGDVGLRPLFAALAGNRTLRTLNCRANNISRECARDIMLPAVRANASLRNLDLLQFSWEAAGLIYRSS
jgi:hypothetical protein